jgi:transcriptional regulator with XRE-family HTH domain
MEFMKRFGEKLRVLRERRGLSLKQLGDQLEVGKNFVWEMEKGKKIPNIAMLTKICDIFGVSCDKLIRDELEIDPEASAN